MNEFENQLRPNSHKSKAEEEQKRRVEKVVTGTVKTKKRNGVHKLADVFISEDIANVKNYVIGDVLIPAIKKAVSDIVTNGIDMILYGESGRHKKSTSASYVSYSRFSDRRDDRRDDSMRARSAYSYDEIIFNTRGDAEEVLSCLEDMIEQYGTARVADLYDLAGITSNNYTDNNYGWTSLASAEPTRAREGGYVLRLPRAVPIDRR